MHFLNSDWTFEDFVVGLENTDAFETARTFAAEIGQTDTPLIIKGFVGEGKTFLLQAIANSAKALYPASEVVYFTVSDFLSDVVCALAAHRVEEFIRGYHPADVLLIDDFHYLSGKPKTQEILGVIVRRALERRAAVAVASEEYPEELPQIDENLIALLAAGRGVSLGPPSLETRMAILLRKSKRDGVELSEGAARALAGASERNIRILEFYYLQVAAYSKTTRGPITERTVAEALRRMRP